MLHPFADAEGQLPRDNRAKRNADVTCNGGEPGHGGFSSSRTRSVGGRRPALQADWDLDVEYRYTRPRAVNLVDTRRMRDVVSEFAPAVNTVCATVLLAGVVTLLSWDASNGSTKSDKIVAGGPWLVWRFTAGLTVVLFVVLLVQGTSLIIQLYRDSIGFPRRRIVWFLVFAAISAAAVGAAITKGASAVTTRNSLILPINSLDFRTAGVVAMGAAAAIPWLTLVWLIHSECRDIKTVAIKAGPPSPGRGQTIGTPLLYPAVKRLLDLWELLVCCVLAFALFVVAALLTTGTLRAVFLDAFPSRKDEYPSTNVLLYGAAFAVFLLLVSLPMVISWRSKAAYVLDCAAPIPSDLNLSDAWVKKRSHMEALLKLDVSLLRSPLTLLITLAPLVTSLLAAFIPELTSK
jgi:hypothetical protein